MTKKFRIWDGQKFLNEEEHSLYISQSGYLVHINTVGEQSLASDNNKVSWWTGLTDSQGVEIYEGDIVSAIYPEYKTAKVFFCVNSGSFRLLSGNVALPMVTMRTQGGQSPKLINVFEKVIGNIFQTHELLEKS